MFEPVQDQKQTSTNWFWIGIALVVALAVAGIFFYKMSSRTAKGPAPAATPAAAPAKGNADPVHDLKILSVKMDKDRTGVTAVWSVTIENRSTVYAYSDIRYETSYMGADNKPIVVNQGAISTTIGPREQKNPEFRDALYPTGTAWYNFRITGATPTIP